MGLSGGMIAPLHHTARLLENIPHVFSLDDGLIEVDIGRLLVDAGGVRLGGVQPAHILTQRR
ncbi:hypothetical protein SDC9_183175 [bioreactor metagenome]|uniref:Uncharacterized protein n=1 Tax=bioreactor metagenome TaxID=1076179 RepID=A0A645H9J4_9ZZZZ